MHDWHPEDVKAAVRKLGLTFRAIGRANGLHFSALTRALRQPYPRAEAILAKHLQLSPSRIWPTRYDRHGTPLAGRAFTGSEASRPGAAPQRQKRRAA